MGTVKNQTFSWCFITERFTIGALHCRQERWQRRMACPMRHQCSTGVRNKSLWCNLRLIGQGILRLSQCDSDTKSLWRQGVVCMCQVVFAKKKWGKKCTLGTPPFVCSTKVLLRPVLKTTQNLPRQSSVVGAIDIFIYTHNFLYL